ncbi:PREDICTED: piggyBac transposable element-derived protein 4-like [Polistes canadensis]|uniref:piggyBac transposable element-derived protein 4-like n=1 Tax=Polistes canadensis TaxID=91411 RepID=UPI000718DAB0|nr:PREDICTED: piggyBac transposable element-derived protein 4-like [Polistes canadensis]
MIPTGSYWSRKLLLNFDIPHLIMQQSRFELLLSNIHFADNTTIAPGNPLNKIFPLYEILQANYQKILTPGENIIINETLIPWHGRPIFNQYIPNKAYEYGIKLFKLCTPEGFTWSMMMFSTKYCDVRETRFAYNVCVALAKNLFNQGRTLYINNFYISYEFAISCLKQKTHVVGLVRNNKRSIPKDILQSKLQKGEMISKEDDNGIIILKWRDSRDVRILSTKHVPLMIPCIKYWDIINKASNNSKSCVKLKPIAFIDYNKKKCIIDHSEQLISHITTIIKGMKWYQKLGMQFLLGVTVVNAFVIYNQATNKNIQIEQFKEILAQQLLELIFCKL